MAALHASPSLPDTPTLADGLSRLLVAGDGARPTRVTVLDRKAFKNSSSFASEVVICRRGGETLRLLCKYSSKWVGPSGEESWGYRRGVLHEAGVYRHILQPMNVTVPHFFGTNIGPRGETWMVLEYLEDAAWVSEADDPAAMALAARWIGRFHALAETRLAAVIPWLKTYDAEYFRGWVQRTLQFAGPWHMRFPWLRMVAGRFDDWAARLWEQPTVMHGEYYPKNVLIHRGRIYPVDWECAAVAAGEIDLVALTEMWPASAVDECRIEYARARWPDGAPADFERRLDSALMFNMFRWLGDEPEMTRRQSMRYYFDQLRAAAARLGLIKGSRE